MMVQLQPTEFFWPAAYMGGPARRVYLCQLGCLVLEGSQQIHQTQAHTG